MQNKVSVELKKENNKTILKKDNNTFNVNVFENSPLPLDKWIKQLKTIKIDDGNLDLPSLLTIIHSNNKKIKQEFDFVKKFKEEFTKSPSLKEKKCFKKEIKSFSISLNDYLNLIDDIIYNVQVDWNDLHNFNNHLNLFNTVLEKVDEHHKTKSILIEKPTQYNVDEISNFHPTSWNSKVINKIINDHHDGFDAKAYTKYLNGLSYNVVASLLSKTTEQSLSLKGYINALETLYISISTKKIHKLQSSLYALINNLQEDSKSVADIIKSLNKNLVSYTSASDLELLEDILASINKEHVLEEINNEILQCKIIFDMFIRKYSIIQNIAQQLFIKEIKNVANIKDEKHLKKRTTNPHKIIFADHENTKVKTTSSLADYTQASKFRDSLQKSIIETTKLTKKISKSTNIDEILNLYFQKINAEAGIIYDLKELIELLGKQFNKDISKKISNSNEQSLSLDVAKFIRTQTLKIKLLSAQNLIYESIIKHLTNLLVLEDDIHFTLSKLDQDWLVHFDKWIELKNNTNKVKKTIDVKNKKKSSKK